MRQFFQLKVIHVDSEILLQKRGVFFFQLEDGVLHHGKVGLSFTVGLLELLDVGGHQWTLGVIQELPAHWVKRKRVEAARERLIVAHGAPLIAQVLTTFFNTHTAQFLFFRTGEADFKGGVPIVDGATTLALGTVVKQHSWPQTNHEFPAKAQRQGLVSHDAGGHCVAISDVTCHGQIFCALLLLLLMQVGICGPTLQ